MDTIIDYKLLGQRLQQQRKLTGITQEQLADILNYTPGYISQIERGVTKVNLDTLASICAVYDCDIAEVVTGINRKQTSYLSDDLASLCNQLTKKESDILLTLLDSYIKYKGEK